MGLGLSNCVVVAGTRVSVILFVSSKIETELLSLIDPKIGWNKAYKMEIFISAIIMIDLKSVPSFKVSSFLYGMLYFKRGCKACEM